MLTSLTYADILRPNEKRLAVFYDIALIIVGSLFIAVFAQIAVGGPVPFTGQTFAVLMIGALFGARRGGLCLLVYIAEGTGGLPVFAQGKSSFAALAGPTGGYIIGFVFAAYIVGLLSEKGWDHRFRTTVLAMVLGNVVIYAFGLFWLSVLVGTGKALAVGLYPFIAGDFLKIVLAAVILPTGWKLLKVTDSPAKENKSGQI